MNYYVITINGQKAVKSGYTFCNGKCYATVLCGLAQLEVVIDEPGLYNGIPQKWVSCAYIKQGSDIPVVLDYLKNVGFDGCKCIISKCVEIGCYAKEEELYCTII